MTSTIPRHRLAFEGREATHRLAGRVAALPFDMLPLLGLVLGSAWIAFSGTMSSPWRLGGFAVLIMGGIFIPFWAALRGRHDLSFFALVPTVYAAVQNVYLAPASPHMTAAETKILLAVNILVPVLFLGALLLTNPPPWRAALRSVPLAVSALLISVVTVYSVLSWAVLELPLTPIIASTRNLLSPCLFLLLGWFAAQRASTSRYCRLLVLLSLAVVIFGFVERMLPSLWRQLHIDTLWERKDLPIDPFVQLPANFFASEQIGGEFIRRMVSSFADPVNLGTFLFAGFLAAWYTRNRTAMILIPLACALTISKGALLGFLIFAVVHTLLLRSRRAAAFIALSAAAAGGAFFAYTRVSSTGSATAHVDGLLTGFRELPRAPWGHGIGNSGVLSQNLTSAAGVDSSAAESGIGVALGQMGIPGLLVLMAFFGGLAIASWQLPDPRQRTLALSVLACFGANAALNEVALSPNSSAPYFVILGLLLSPAVLRRNPLQLSAARVPAPVALSAVVVAIASSVGIAASTEPTQSASLDAVTEPPRVVRNPAKQIAGPPTSEDLANRAVLYADYSQDPEILSQVAARVPDVGPSVVVTRVSATPVPGEGQLEMRAYGETADQAVRILATWASVLTSDLSDQRASATRESRQRWIGLSTGAVQVREEARGVRDWMVTVLRGLLFAACLWIMVSSVGSAGTARSRAPKVGRRRQASSR